MEKTNFDLGPREAALIFKEDNSIEIVIPSMDDDETVDFEKNQNIFVALAVAGCSDDDDFRKIIGQKLNSMLGGAEGCSPEGSSGCGGGCCGCADDGFKNGDGTGFKDGDTHED